MLGERRDFFERGAEQASNFSMTAWVKKLLLSCPPARDGEMRSRSRAEAEPTQVSILEEQASEQGTGAWVKIWRSEGLPRVRGVRKSVPGVKVARTQVSSLQQQV